MRGKENEALLSEKSDRKNGKYYNQTLPITTKEHFPILDKKDDLIGLRPEASGRGLVDLPG